MVEFSRLLIAFSVLDLTYRSIPNIFYISYPVSHIIYILLRVIYSIVATNCAVCECCHKKYSAPEGHKKVTIGENDPEARRFILPLYLPMLKFLGSVFLAVRPC